MRVSNDWRERVDWNSWQSQWRTYDGRRHHHDERDKRRGHVPHGGNPITPISPVIPIDGRGPGTAQPLALPPRTVELSNGNYEHGHNRNTNYLSRHDTVNPGMVQSPQESLPVSYPNTQPQVPIHSDNHRGQPTPIVEIPGQTSAGRSLETYPHNVQAGPVELGPLRNQPVHTTPVEIVRNQPVEIHNQPAGSGASHDRITYHIEPMPPGHTASQTSIQKATPQHTEPAKKHA